MLQIFTVIAPLFLIIIATAILQKVFNLGGNWSTVLNEYAYKIGLPVLVFTALAQMHFSLADQKLLIIVNALFVLTCLAVTIILFKLFKSNKETLRTAFICIAFGNVAYLGIPVLIQVRGEDILPEASLIIGVYLFILFSIGIGGLDFIGKKHNKDILRNTVKTMSHNPLLLSVVLGLLAGSTNFRIPKIVLQSLDMVSASVTPTVLIIIGLFIGKSKLGKVREWVPVILFSFITLLALPYGLTIGLIQVGLNPQDFFTTIIQAAMPLAITPFALADEYKLDKKFIARSIVLSTLLSIATLPLWITII